MKNFELALLLLLVTSCSTSQIALNDNDYSMERERKFEQYNCFYFVDTISILSPIVFTVNTHKYICSEDIIKGNSIDDAFLNRPDVFLFQQNVGGYYDFMSAGMIEKYIDYDNNYKDRGTCHIKENSYNLRYKRKEVPTFKFSETELDLALALINLKFYNMKSNCIDCGTYKAIRNSEPQNSYYKIVFTIDNVEYCR